MISRIWHGWTTLESADKYESLLRADVLPGIHRIMGYNGAYLLRREAANREIEFMTITQFTDITAVKAFAGKDYERAVIAPTVNPAAVNQVYGIHGPQVPSCGAGSNSFKGLVNDSTPSSVPAWWAGDTGVHAGPVRNQLARPDACTTTDGFDNWTGCTIIVPLCVDGRGNGSVARAADVHQKPRKWPRQRPRKKPLTGFVRRTEPPHARGLGIT